MEISVPNVKPITVEGSLVFSYDVLYLGLYEYGIPLSCEEQTIETLRAWYEIKGSGSIVRIQTFSRNFYPLVSVFKDGCDLTCVSYDIEKVGREDSTGGSTNSFFAEDGESYLVVVHGVYGGEFSMTIEDRAVS